ncbi:MAG: SOS response-associated peptidase, partial [Planctomycetota bacterium]
RRRRCMIPADGWYEWQQLPEGKQPHYVSLPENRPFAFAAIWERWRSPGGETIASCAILTRESDGPLREIHDRMPVVMARELYTRWLDPATEGGLEQCLAGRSGDRFEFHAIGTRVNNVRNDDPDLVAPLG